MHTRTESRPVPGPESLPSGDVVSPWPPDGIAQESQREPLLVAGPIVKLLQSKWEDYKAKPLLADQPRLVSTIEPTTTPYPEEHQSSYDPGEPLLVKGPYAEKVSQRIDEYREKHPIKYRIGKLAAGTVLALSLLGSANAAIDGSEQTRPNPVAAEATAENQNNDQPAAGGRIDPEAERVQAETPTTGVIFGEVGPDAEFAEQLQLDAPTLQVASELHQQYGDYIEQKAAETGIPVENIAAIILSESSGSGFNEDGSVKINFESDNFFEVTGVNIPSDQGQSSEWEAFDQAVQVNEWEAYNNTSFGMGQIMGWNYDTLGYESPRAMAEAFSDPETGVQAQMDGIISFITSNPETLEAARTGQNHLTARNYNGPLYHVDSAGGGGEYHLKLIQNAEAYRQAIEAQPSNGEAAPASN